MRTELLLKKFLNLVGRLRHYYYEIKKKSNFSCE